MTDNFVPVPLNTMDADAWDDTELIAAFDNAVATHRVMENENEAELLPQQPTIKPARQRTPKRKREQQEGTTTSRKRVAPNNSNLQIPPPPPPGDEKLNALLAAWYEAGYRAAEYYVSTRRQ